MWWDNTEFFWNSLVFQRRRNIRRGAVFWEPPAWEAHRSQACRYLVDYMWFILFVFFFLPSKNHTDRKYGLSRQEPRLQRANWNEVSWRVGTYTEHTQTHVYYTDSFTAMAVLHGGPTGACAPVATTLLLACTNKCLYDFHDLGHKLNSFKIVWQKLEMGKL